MKRDNYIDFIRGIAAVWIVLIHTCFWSGGSYVPVWCRSLTLIIDVPLFVFISGMSFNYGNSVTKMLKNIFNIWIKNIYFVGIYFAFIFLFERETFSIFNMIKAIFFKYETKDLLKVVPGSFWFIFMFFIVSLLSSIIICIYRKYNNDLKNFKYILLISFLFYGISLNNSNFIFLSSCILMYMFIFLLGYYLYNYKYTCKGFVWIFTLNIILLFALFKFTGIGFSYMQSEKTSYQLNYLCYSLISINIVTFLKDRLRVNNNIFVMFGKSALLFYFCQGIGGSIIFYVLPYLDSFPKVIKLMIAFGINLLITLILVLIMKLIIYYVSKILKKIKLDGVLVEKKLNN